MTSKVTYSGKEYSGKGTRTSMFLPDVNAANFDAIDTSVDTIQAAINGVDRKSVV